MSLSSPILTRQSSLVSNEPLQGINGRFEKEACESSSLGNVQSITNSAREMFKKDPTNVIRAKKVLVQALLFDRPIKNESIDVENLSRDDAAFYQILCALTKAFNSDESGYVQEREILEKVFLTFRALVKNRGKTKPKEEFKMQNSIAEGVSELLSTFGEDCLGELYKYFYGECTEAWKDYHSERNINVDGKETFKDEQICTERAASTNLQTLVKPKSSACWTSIAQTMRFFMDATQATAQTIRFHKADQPDITPPVSDNGGDNENITPTPAGNVGRDQDKPHLYSDTTRNTQSIPNGDRDIVINNTAHGGSSSSTNECVHKDHNVPREKSTDNVFTFAVAAVGSTKMTPNELIIFTSLILEHVEKVEGVKDTARDIIDVRAQPRESTYAREFTGLSAPKSGEDNAFSDATAIGEKASADSVQSRASAHAELSPINIPSTADITDDHSRLENNHVGANVPGSKSRDTTVQSELALRQGMDLGNSEADLSEAGLIKQRPEAYNMSSEMQAEEINGISTREKLAQWIETNGNWSGNCGDYAANIIINVYPVNLIVNNLDAAGNVLNKIVINAESGQAKRVVELNLQNDHYSPVIDGRELQVARDGNCFFRSIYRAYHGKDPSDKDIQDLRHEVGNYVRNHSEIDNFIPIDDQTADDRAVGMITSVFGENSALSATMGASEKIGAEPAQGHKAENAELSQADSPTIAAMIDDNSRLKNNLRVAGVSESERTEDPSGPEKHHFVSDLQEAVYDFIKDPDMARKKWGIPRRSFHDVAVQVNDDPAQPRDSENIESLQGVSSFTKAIRDGRSRLIKNRHGAGAPESERKEALPESAQSDLGQDPDIAREKLDMLDSSYHENVVRVNDDPLESRESVDIHGSTPLNQSAGREGSAITDQLSLSNVISLRAKEIKPYRTSSMWERRVPNPKLGRSSSLISELNNYSTAKKPTIINKFRSSK
ncbi:hypothetical protein SAMN05216516_11355 [Izhakiella capsodis]|uniref:OTU domain-containing protein n=1 Tax=Izhakiella capsodis TaxID=1367852 RepID=A0A1I5AWJ2_9GAMM|nr:OTU domain-containing protein [Izhakiella capsodis]SFN66814.1 hypothetical protein SAMN05216516_11355 [Izhakiella capsodis]